MSDSSGGLKIGFRYHLFLVAERVDKASESCLDVCHGTEEVLNLQR